MKRLAQILFLIYFPCLVLGGNNDSLHIHFFVGPTLNTYYSKNIKISKQPIGYCFGAGLSKMQKKHLSVATNFWFQHIAFTNIKTSIYDKYYDENVLLKTNISFNQLGFDVALMQYFSKFSFGINGGIYYLINSRTTQDIKGGTGIVATNIFYKYTIYQYQKDSYYNTINPFFGISISYFPFKKWGICYENRFTLLANPSMDYQYFNSFHSMVNNLVLILKIK